MKRMRMWMLAAAAGGICTASAWAQAPAAPAAPAGAAAPAAAAQKKGFFERFCESMERKKRKLCKTPAGQMLNAMTKPLTMGSGGIIPPFCPAMPSKEELAQPGVEGDAARAKKDALEANARRQAVRLLGTFDCHWHPEAQDGLIAALRTDRFECVRLEAAIALNRACCCSKPVIEALMDSVNCGEKFGPSENSPRVQMVAAMALERCLSCYIDTAEEAPPVIEEKKEGEEIPKPRKIDDPNAPASVTKPYVSRKPSRELIEEAKLALAKAKARLANVPMTKQILSTGQRSIFHIANYALEGKPRSVSPPPAPAAIAPEPAKVAPPVINTAKPVAKPATSPVNATPQAAKPVKPATMPVNATRHAAKPVKPATMPVSATPQAAKVVSATPQAAKVVSATPQAAKVVSATPQAIAQPRKIDPIVLKCLEALRDADDPEVRHTAVRNLVACDWHENPEVVLGLLYSARQDQHPGMRVVSIRYLASIKANTPEVVTGLQSLSQDSDAWIRKEAQQALVTLKN